MVLGHIILVVMWFFVTFRTLPVANNKQTKNPKLTPSGLIKERALWAQVACQQFSGIIGPVAQQCHQEPLLSFSLHSHLQCQLYPSIGHPHRFRMAANFGWGHMLLLLHIVWVWGREWLSQNSEQKS